MTTFEREFSISAVLFPSCSASPLDGRPEQQGIVDMSLDHESCACRNHALLGLNADIPSPIIESVAPSTKCNVFRLKFRERHQSSIDVQKEKNFHRFGVVLEGKTSVSQRQVFLRCLPVQNGAFTVRRGPDQRSVAEVIRVEDLRRASIEDCHWIQSVPWLVSNTN